MRACFRTQLLAQLRTARGLISPRHAPLALTIGTVGLGIATYATYSAIAHDILNDSKRKHRSKPRVIVIDDGWYGEEEDEDEDADEDEDEDEEEGSAPLKKKPDLSQILSLDDFEAVARETIDPGTWGYYSTGADDEFSLRENHYAFGRIFFRPRCMVDVEQANPKCKEGFYGAEFDAPFYITAFAGAPRADPDAEKNLIRAAADQRIPYMVPHQCSFTPISEFIKENSGTGQNVFLQCHFYNSKQLAEAPAYFQMMERENPNITCFFVNADLPCAGNREKDIKVRQSLSSEDSDDLNFYCDDERPYKPLTWDDIDRINRATKLPVLLKGVLNREDVLKAAQLGLGGVVISNHGGRQMDFAMPPIEILQESTKLLKENGIDKTQFKVYIDGGVRRGSDILKALCLGASGVGLGRPFAYAMATYGQPGVDRAIEILKREMKRDMKFLGVNSIDELNESYVDTTSLKFKGFNTAGDLYNRNYMHMPGPSFK